MWGITMNTPDPRHAAATAPSPSPQAPQWGGQMPAALDPAMLAHLANAFFNAAPGQTPDPQAFADFSAGRAEVPEPPSSPSGAAGALAALPGLSVPGAALTQPQVSLPYNSQISSLETLPQSLGPATSLVRPDAPRDFPANLQAAADPASTLYFLNEARGQTPGGSINPVPAAAFPSVPTSSQVTDFQPGVPGPQLQQPPSYGRNYPNESELRPQDLSTLQGLPPVTFPNGYQHGADPRAGEANYFVGESRGAKPAGGGVGPVDDASLNVPSAHTPATTSFGRSIFDPRAIKKDFPILNQRVHGKQLVWLDNAATTQKPKAVIERLTAFYETENSNIHRGAHALAARATDAYEAAREKVRRFLGAGSPNEIVFTRGATEAINLVAQSWGRRNVREGDEIVITWLEHHANIVPWQMLCQETGARLRVAPVDDSGQIMLDEYTKLLGPRTRLVALPQVSNALGTITPAQEMVAIAHRHGACVLVDGAQSVSHMPVDVQALDCDFFVFSGHKVFAPTGIGALYAKPDVLAHMPPWQGGGNMIADVTFEKTLYNPPPGRFEAGTGNIADAVGLGAAIDYVEAIGMANIEAYEHGLLLYMTEGLHTVPGLQIIGTAKEKAGVVSFVLDGCRVTEVGTALDREGIAVRSGHHCAQPILRRFGLEATVRPSLAFYNTCEDIDALVAALKRIQAQKGKRS